MSKNCTQLFKILYEAKHISQNVNSCKARRLDKFAGSEYKNIIFYNVFFQGHSIKAILCRTGGMDRSGKTNLIDVPKNFIWLSDSRASDLV